MKTIFSQPSRNSFPYLLLTAAVSLTGTVLWFVWHNTGSDNLPANIEHQHSFWASMSIVLVLVITLSAWLATIRHLRRSQKTVLTNNAEREWTQEALQQSEARFRELIENANDLIYTTDFQGRFTSLSKVGEAVTGYTKDEFCRMSFTEIVVPEHHQLARRMPAVEPNNNAPTSHEIEIIAKSGERVALDISSRMIYESGKPVGVQGIGRDVTARKRAEETLRESEARYRVVTESASDAILTIDREQTIHFVNPAAEKIFGYAADEMLGQKLSMLIPENLPATDAAGLERPAETAERDISLQAVELRGLHKDGREVPIEITFGEINSDGEQMFTAIIRDITERKRAKEELQKNLSLLTSTFEATADGILVVDRNNRIVTYNQHFVDMAQIPDEVIRSLDNKKVIDFVLDQLADPESFVDKTKQLVLQPESHSYDTIEFKDGRIFERFSHPQILDGKVIGRVVNFRDVTERQRTENALLENERYLRTLLENINEGLVQTSVDDVIEFVNNRFCEMTGFDRDELLGKVSFDVIFDGEGSRFIRDANENRLQGISGQYEIRIKKKSGDMLWVIVGGSPIVNADGKVTGKMGVFTDITERKQAEETLQGNLSLLKSMFEATADGILVVDDGNKIVTYNKQFVDMGHIPDEIIGTMDDSKVAAYVMDQLLNADVLSEKIEQLNLHPEIDNCNVMEFKDGRVYESYSYPRSLDGKVVGRVVSFREITERRHSEEALRRSEEKHRTILETIEEVYFEMDLAGNFTFFNDAMGGYLGYDEDELIGLNYRQYLDEEAAQNMSRVYNQIFVTGVPIRSIEYEVIRKDGTRVPNEGSASLIRNAANEPVGFRGVVRDISDRKRAQLESQVISEIIQGVATTSNLDELLALAHQSIGKAIYAENFYVALYDKQSELLQIPFRVDKFDAVSLPQKPGKGLTAHVYRNGRATLLTKKAIQQLNEQGEIELAGTPPAIWLGIPLRTPNGVIGVLVVQHYDDEAAFAERDIELMTAVGDQIALAIERKSSEEELRKSKENFDQLANNITDVFWIRSPDMKELHYVSPAFERIWGRSADSRYGEPKGSWADTILPEDRDRITTAYQTLMTDAPNIDVECRIRRSDGQVRWIRSRGFQIRNAEGKLIRLTGIISDVTERKEAENKVRESAYQLAAAQRITHLGSWVVDLTGSEDVNKNEVSWSDENYRIFGFEPGQVEISSELFYNAVHPDDRSRVADLLNEAIEQRQPYKIQHRIILPDGSERIVQGHAELIFDDRTGKPIKMLGTLQDITERKRAEDALRESEHKLRTLFASMSEGMTQIDNYEVIEFVNDRLCEMTGYDRKELLGKTTSDILLDEEGRRVVGKANEQRRKGISSQYELRLKKKSGETLWVLISGAPIVDDNGVVTGTLELFMDISERKRVEEQLLHDAFHDGLTGLANRALFMDHLRMTIERCKGRHSKFYAVLFLDFDRFKVINDSLGHAEGDELLRQISRRLEAATRTGDLVARLGGDEFVILLSEMLEANDAIQVAERIQNDLKNPFDLSGSEIFMSASIGIAHSGAGHKRAEDMLGDADIAMYNAKAKGKAQYQVFNQAMHAQATKRLQLETEMRQALERGEFELHYQPIINLGTNELNGFEALVRWRHPERGLIPPMEFIPAAEENGLILPLGRWILRESCRQMREWQNDNLLASGLTINVNLSCKQFLQSDLAEQVTETLDATGLAPRCLKLEITESYLIENSENAVKIMNRLRALGVELSLDDFGTGYSSLSYLHRLPINSLKIDRSFVSRMAESDENSEIVRTIIRLAQNLKMKVVAEGIETAEQLAALNRLNCGFGQGYFFSKPLEAERATAFINENLENMSAMPDQPTINLELNM